MKSSTLLRMLKEIYLCPDRVADIRIILGERLDQILHEGDVDLMRGVRRLDVSELVSVT